MKKLFKTISLLLILTSCAPSVYYQVCTTESENVKKLQEKLIYENDVCIISYNFWQEYGNIGFLFTNKTNRDISINLRECFFIRNGIAYDYFQNRIFSDMISTGSSTTIGVQKSKATSLSKMVTGEGVFNTIISKSASVFSENSLIAGNTTTLQKSVSTSYQEKDVIVIPANTSKLILEFHINDVVIRHCDLLLYPENKDIKAINFTKENSPLVFSNLITYYFNDEDQNKNKIENKFWISEITNLPNKKATVTDYEVICGEKTQTQKTYFRDPKPNKFYIEYHLQSYL